MEETHQTEDEKGETGLPPEPSPPQKPSNGAAAKDAKASPNGDESTDAVTGMGAVAGRGPGSTMDVQPKRVGLARGLASLRHRDFRLFWFGQLVSLTGTWMQVLGQGWLVLEIGGSALDLGTISALQFLPALVFSLFGGILADHFPKRRLLLATQSTAMVLAFVLALLTLNGAVTVLHVMIIAALLGLVNAFDMPTRQSYVVELVGRKDLANAIALNSAEFNVARMAGPALGGLLIGWLGTGTVFLLNGFTFLPVLAALLAIRAGSTPAVGGIQRKSVFTNVREGLSYVRHTSLLLATVGMVAVVGTFGMNFSVVAPLLARDLLNVGANGLGVLMSAMGLGSLLASLMLAFVEWAPHPRLLVGSAAVFGLLELVLSQTTQFWPAAILLGATGFAMIFFATVANTTMQTSTPDHLRGRVMSVYITVFVGTTPFGSLFAGTLAQLAGVQLPLLVGGAISVSATLIAWWRMMRFPAPEIRR